MPDPAQQPLVDMVLVRIVTHDLGDQHSIVLAERSGGRSFPILIGTAEAREIQRVATGQDAPRPTTHRLLHAAVGALGGALARVEITALSQHTFFAQLVLVDGAGAERTVDARPSDAVALALRARCPIHVAPAVLDAAAGPPPGGPEGEPSEGDGPEPPPKPPTPPSGGPRPPRGGKSPGA